ncbi:MAG: hypothetical protein WC606_05555 [Candidatus Absconditabacterales bacterium]
MNVTELKSRIETAKIYQKSRGLSAAGQILKFEITNFENKIREVMGKTYDELEENEIVPSEIEQGAYYLTSCHGLGTMYMYLCSSLLEFFL